MTSSSPPLDDPRHNNAELELGGIYITIDRSYRSSSVCCSQRLPYSNESGEVDRDASSLVCKRPHCLFGPRVASSPPIAGARSSDHDV